MNIAAVTAAILEMVQWVKVRNTPPNNACNNHTHNQHPTPRFYPYHKPQSPVKKQITLFAIVGVATNSLYYNS